jgi:hypothetical protein
LKFFAMMRERERKTTHTQDRIEPMVELNIPAIYALFVLRSRRRKKDNEVFFSFREFLNNLRTRRATLFGENNNNLQKKIRWKRVLWVLSKLCTILDWHSFVTGRVLAIVSLFFISPNQENMTNGCAWFDSTFESRN